MTLRQKRTLKLLPKHNYKLAPAMREAGYTQMTSNSGTQYKNLRKLTEIKFDLADLTPELVIKGILKEADTAKHSSDKLRAYELCGKYLAMFTDKVETKHQFSDAIYFMTKQKILNRTKSIAQLPDDNSSITKARLNDNQTIDTKPLTISNTVQPDRHPDDKSNAQAPDDTPDDKPVNSNQSTSKDV